MTRLRDRVGLNLPPLFLRLALGVVFVWAGLWKVSASSPLEGEDAAILANMGVIAGPVNTTIAPRAEPNAKPAEPPKPEAPAKTEPAPTGEEPKSKVDTGSANIVLARQAVPATTYEASDFPKPVSVLNVYSLALMISKAAHPAAAGGNTSAAMPLWPSPLADGRWPVYLAWAVALTELIAGAAVLLGLFTRVMALALAGVMIGAIWLTQIGPAIQSGNTVLGFLPAKSPWDLAAWQPFWQQFVLLMTALALAFCGPGRASLDRAILGGPDAEDDDDE